MSTTTTHNVQINVNANAKQANQNLAQTKNLLTSMHKGTFRQQVLQQGVAKTIAKQQATLTKAQKTAGPQQLQMLKAQNQQLAQQGKHLNTLQRGWQKVAQAAGAAYAKMRGGGGGGGRRGGGGGGGGKPVPGFGAGFSDAMGFGGGGPSRYGIGHGLGRGMRYGIGMGGSALAALFAMPFQAVSSDYQAYHSYSRGLSQLAGLNQGSPFGAGVTRGGIDSLRDKMVGLGYSPEETTQSARQFSRATGSVGDTRFGMTAARLTNMDPSEIANIMADMRRAGGGFGEKGQREFQRMLQAAVKGGVDASTLPEYLEGVQHLTSRSSGVLGGRVSTEPYAQMLALFNKSGLAGLQGARGASTLSTLEDMIRHPGGGEEGQAAMLAAMGFGRAGSGVSFYEAKKQQESGLQGNSLRGIFDYVDQITGGGELANLYTQELTGGRLSLSQIEEVRKAMDSGATSDQVDAMLKDMTATELDVLRSIDSNLRDLLGGAEHTAKIQVDGIKRGEKYKEPLEAIQELLQNWMNFMSGPVKTTLDGINNAMQVLVPAVQDLVEFLQGQDDRSVVMSEDAEKGLERYRQLRQSGENTELLSSFAADPTQLTDEQLREVATESLEASDALRAAYSNPSFLQSLAEMIQSPFASAGLITGTDADQAASARTFELERVVRALDILADRLGRGDEIDPRALRTEQQIVAAMQQLGLTPPATFRASVDSTGGAP